METTATFFTWFHFPLLWLLREALVKWIPSKSKTKTLCDSEEFALGINPRYKTESEALLLP